MHTIKFNKVYYGSYFMWHTDWFEGHEKDVFETKKQLIEYYKVTDIKKVGKAFAVGNRTGYYEFPEYEGISHREIPQTITQ